MGERLLLTPGGGVCGSELTGPSSSPGTRANDVLHSSCSVHCSTAADSSQDWVALLAGHSLGKSLLSLPHQHQVSKTISHIYLVI